MFTKTRILLSLIFLIIGTSLNAQEQIERLFRSDRQNTGIDVAQTSDEGYLLFSAGRHLDSMRFDYYTVSKFDNKGNFAWSKDYSFEHKVFPDGSITLLEADSFVISGVLDTTSINKVLMKGDPNGNVVWTRGYGRDDMNMPLALGDASVDTSYRKGFYIAGDVYGLANSTDIYLSEADTLGNQLWGKYYSQTGGFFNTTKVRMAQDSGAIICGTSIDGINPDMFLVKTDRFGNIEWSRDYGENTLIELGTTVAPTPDGGYLLGGQKINPLLPSHPGVLVKTDTFGVTQWVRNVDFQTSDTILINDIIIADDGDAVVSGSLLGITPGDVFAFMMKIDMDGDIVWKRRYKAATRQFTFSNGLIESPFEGFVYLTTSDEGTDQVGPYLIKTDADGQTICDSIVEGQLIFPDIITVDTLELTETDIMDTKDIIVVDTLNYNFNLVTLELETFGPYCPDSLFSDTLDATVVGAVAYEWSTGETTPTIVVTEFDEYMVTVTIGEDYCYLLCASSTISPLPLPMVELDLNDASFCSTGIVDINASTSATDDIVWSTGEMQTNTIMVTTEESFSVTVSNTCGTETADIDVVFDTSPPTVNIDGSNTFCAEGMETLTATYSFGDGVNWSTGEGTDVITVDALGNYSVTVLSNFCDDGTANYTVEAADITGDITSDNTFCATGSEQLTVSTSSPATGISWSTGETTATITVTNSADIYSVTVSDFCDNGTTEYSVITTQITADVSGDGTFCATGDELLTASPDNGTPNSFNWSTGETTPTITVINSDDTYSVTVSDFCGDAIAEYMVSTSQIGVAISGDESFCVDGDELLNAIPENGTPSSYTWSTGDNTPTTTALVQGTYTLTVTDFCGEATDSISILCPIVFDIPNAFTPNGDNISEVLIPVFDFDPSELVTYEFAVYSRWGEKVFETTDPLVGWDGTVNDEAGLSDVYIYTVNGVNNLGVALTHLDTDKDNHGDVTLIR